MTDAQIDQAVQWVSIAYLVMLGGLIFLIFVFGMCLLVFGAEDTRNGLCRLGLHPRSWIRAKVVVVYQEDGGKASVGQYFVLTCHNCGKELKRTPL